MRKSVRLAVQERSAGWCEAEAADNCTGRASHIHHRLLRSQGGTDDLEFLLHVCDVCHRYIHDHPQRSYEMRWLVHAWEKSA